MSQADPPWRTPDEERRILESFGRRRADWRGPAVDVGGLVVLAALVWWLLARG